MPRKSRKTGTKAIKIAEDERSEDAMYIPDVTLLDYFQHDSVSISLKYYQKSCECFSKWKSPELKKLAQTIEKIRGYALSDFMAHTPLCDSHKGEPKKARFRRPEEVSEDVNFYEIKVDPSNKARIHGFFVQSVFFLVWLDRSHGCFPE